MSQQMDGKPFEEVRVSCESINDPEGPIEGCIQLGAQASYEMGLPLPRNPVVKAMGFFGAVLTFPASFVPAFVLEAIEGKLRLPRKIPCLLRGGFPGHTRSVRWLYT